MKTKSLLLILLAITISIGFNACIEFHDCLNGNYKVETEVREVSSFDDIISEGSYEINVTLGDKNEVVVEAESNLLYYIQTRVEGNDLVIKTRTSRCIDANYPIVITIITTNLEKITLAGSGIITCNNINVPELEVDLIGSGLIDITAEIEYLDARIAGSGDIHLVGHAIESDLNIAGSGSVRGYNFEHDNCFATISGSGNMYVFVNELLDIRITGSGSISYLGNPEINASITGTGTIINAN